MNYLMTGAVLCGCVASAQEKHVTVGLTTHSPMQIAGSQGPVNVDVMRTDIQYTRTNGEPQLGKILTVYDSVTKLLWWTYADGPDKSSTGSQILSWTQPFFVIDNDSITNFVCGSALIVRQSKLRADSSEKAFEKALSEMDQHTSDLRAGNVTMMSEKGKKEWHRWLPYPQFSRDFRNPNNEAFIPHMTVVSVEHKGRIWLVTIKLRSRTALIEVDEALTKIVSMKENPPTN